MGKERPFADPKRPGRHTQSRDPAFQLYLGEGPDLLALNFPEQLGPKHPAFLAVGELLGGSTSTGPSPVTPCPLGPGPGMTAQQPAQDNPKN